MRELLCGKKLALEKSDTVGITVPRLKPITVEAVLTLALENKEICKYLPDKADLEKNYIDRDFLFTLIHTLEPSFFRRTLKEYYDKHREEKMKRDKDMIAINPNMMAILNRFKQNAFSRAGKRKRKVALAQLRVGKMKRKRAPQTKTTLVAKLGSVKHFPAVKGGPNSILKIKRVRPNGIGAEKENEE